MGLRISGGLLRGRLIQTPKGDQTRPTLDMVRAALFNILQTHIEEALFLDLFAGSGAMGFEALSRGAKRAIFVEKDRNALACLKENINTLDLSDQSLILPGDSFKLLDRLPAPFDIVYIDPPYATKPQAYAQLLHFFDQENKMRPDGRLIIEEDQNLSALCESLPLKRLTYKGARQYGNTHLQLFAASHSAPEQ